MKFLRYIPWAIVLVSLFAGAADLAVLQNGFSIRHERREVLGNNTRLYLDASPTSGYVEVPTAQIVSIAPDDSPPATQNPNAAGQNRKTGIPDYVAAASTTTGIDPDLIDSVIHAESSYNPRAVSHKGARGLMQLMPGTAVKLGVADPFDPQANVAGGSLYLRELLLQYHSDMAKALAAYNAGPQRVDRYHGVPPYRETYSYVARVISDFNRKKLAAGLATAPKSKLKCAGSPQNLQRCGLDAAPKSFSHSGPDSN